MAETDARLYEGLFLLDQSAIAGDLNAGITVVREMLERADAEIVSLRKWDDRRLAYTIKGQKRGTFLLGLFRVAPFQIANIERDVNLSDEVLRALMIKADHYGEVELEQELDAAKTSAAEQAMREESDESASSSESSDDQDAPQTEASSSDSDDSSSEEDSSDDQSPSRETAESTS